ncbi:MAG: hypothetical protein KF782_12325 [Labilithrix sp.]|nr:hypothetical protein [Labilithrix sp.]
MNDDGSGPSCAGVGLVWSNTRPDGSARGTSSCNGWTSVEAVGRLGSSSSVQDGRWTDECLSSCSQEARLYCFEQ